MRPAASAERAPGGPDRRADPAPPQRTLHVGVIMDGNGRWAQAKGLPRHLGHRAGVRAVRRVVSAAPAHGIGTLTLYAFSCDNWQRPAEEVDALMSLFEGYLGRERGRAVREGLRLSVIGRRDRLRPSLLRAIAGIEAQTAHGSALHLRLAVDYSGRDAILAAAASAPPDRRAFELSLRAAMHSPVEVPNLDLVIRTGGEQRLSDFLLWECAYAELYFTDRLWPDFDAGDLARAVAEFDRRERRFGGLPGAAVARRSAASPAA